MSAVHCASFASGHRFQSFFGLFPLGRGLVLGRSVSDRQLRRMFTYYDCRFAHDPVFLAHCANVSHRHATNRAVGIRVCSHPDAFAKFKEHVQDASFLQKLQRAKAQPTGAEARQVLKDVIGFINTTAARVPWGKRERAAEVTAFIAGQRMHGAASIFYTVAPDDVHVPLAVRLSFPHVKQGAFPHVAEGGFIKALQGTTKGEKRPLNWIPPRNLLEWTVARGLGVQG